jgi:hypothetical protein
VGLCVLGGWQCSYWAQKRERLLAELEELRLTERRHAAAARAKAAERATEAEACAARASASPVDAKPVEAGLSDAGREGGERRHEGGDELLSMRLRRVQRRQEQRLRRWAREASGGTRGATSC